MSEEGLNAMKSGVQQSLSLLLLTTDFSLNAMKSGVQLRYFTRMPAYSSMFECDEERSATAHENSQSVREELV